MRLHEAPLRAVEGKCYIRFLGLEEARVIPSPYDRHGMGSLFYMTHRMVRSNGHVRLVRMNTLPSGLCEGFAPSVSLREKLRGLDLFCSGGNFGRGIEDGGAVQMHWANDIWPIAMHTYMANGDHGDIRPFLGSVDDLHDPSTEGQNVGVNSPPRRY